MEFNFSFNDVCDFIREDSSDSIEDIENLIKLVKVFSPIIFQSTLPLPLLAIGFVADIISMKKDITETSKRLFNKVTSKKGSNSLDKNNRMFAAYYLISLTAFFEAIKSMFADFEAELKLSAKEKFQITQKAIDVYKDGEYSQKLKKKPVKEPERFSPSLSLPHPVESFDVQKEQLNCLYIEMSKGFFSFIQCLVFWDELNETQREKIKEKSEKLPELAWELFRAQYFYLACHFEEFFIWADLFEHEETQKYLKDLSGFVQKYADLVNASKVQIDIGMHFLSTFLEQLPEKIISQQTVTILDELKKYYISEIEEPLIKDEYESMDSEDIRLNFPKISEQFIPQAYKAFRYTKKVALESDEIWQNIPIRNDLGAFILSYLESPYSTSKPLIILGHPGSGKSLLSKILAARLATDRYTPIRVALREVTAEGDIPLQIEEQITRLTRRPALWATISEQCRDKPPVVILDGYDELLQASGHVFADYIRKVEGFQITELRLDRILLRTIITSRLTLIDKAIIPIDSTIIRLLEFNETKQNQWISIWNNTNQSIFNIKKIEKFDIPRNNENIRTLANQPLLLLMLAIYDSDGNQLKKSDNLNQSVLYNSLLRRFIKRQRMKNPLFRQLSEEAKQEKIEKDMQRLGVAAIGMFNRRRLSITIKELDQDLTFYNFKREVQTQEGELLSQAELLLGSFFFVHESITVHNTEDEKKKNIDTSFEFLHNTFGEFLVADFILRKISEKTHEVSILKNNPGLQASLDHIFTSFSGFTKDWYTCFMYTPLMSRPVILEMMREWIEHYLDINMMSREDFLINLDLIVTKQVNLLISGNELPDYFLKQSVINFQNYPQTGYSAIYSLNLILSIVSLSPNGFEFDEGKFVTYEDGTRVWDRLTHIWRSWFSIDALNGLSTIWIAKRVEKKILLKINDSLLTLPNQGRLDLALNVGLAMVDDILNACIGLIQNDNNQGTSFILEDFQEKAENEGLGLRFEYILKNFRYINNQEITYTQFESLLNEAFEILNQKEINQEILVTFWNYVITLSFQFLDKRILFLFHQKFFRIRDYLYNKIKVFEIIAPALIRLAYMTGEWDFLDFFYYRIIDMYESQKIKIKISSDFAYEIVKLGQNIETGEMLINHYHVLFGNYLNSRNIRKIPLPIATEFIKLAREMGDRETLIKLYQGWFVGFSRGRESHTLSPLLLTEFAKFGRDIVDDDKVNQIFINWLFGFIKERDLSSIQPKLLLKYIKIARELGDKEIILTQIRSIFTKTYRLHPKLIIEFGKLARELGYEEVYQNLAWNKENLKRFYPGPLSLSRTIEYIQLAQVFGDEEMEIDKERIRLSEILEQQNSQYQSPQSAYEIIKVVNEIGDINISKMFASWRYWDSLEGKDTVDLPLALVIELLKLARDTKNQRIIKLLDKWLVL